MALSPKDIQRGVLEIKCPYSIINNYQKIFRGVLEMKCPYSINKTNVNTIDVPSIIDQHLSVYLKVVDSKPELDKSCKCTCTRKWLPLD